MKLIPLIESEQERNIRRNLGKWFRLLNSHEGKFFVDQKSRDPIFMHITDMNYQDDPSFVVGNFLRDKNVDGMISDTITDDLQDDLTYWEPNWVNIKRHLMAGNKIKSTTTEEWASELTSDLIQGFNETGEFPEDAFEEDKWWE